jgi:Uma2 family endonuclease
MRPSSYGMKLTYDDLVRFPDDGMRHELIDGKHYVTASPNARHQIVLGEIHGHIWSYLQRNSNGHIFLSPLDVVFSPNDVVEPDLLFVSKSRAGEVLTPKHVRGAPDLVVEIEARQTRARDETIKRRTYERFGVNEYWIVNLELDSIKVYRHINDRLQRVADLRLARNDVLTTPLLPGFEVPLARLFTD